MFTLKGVPKFKVVLSIAIYKPLSWKLNGYIIVRCPQSNRTLKEELKALKIPSKLPASRKAEKPKHTMLHDDHQLKERQAFRLLFKKEGD